MPDLDGIERETGDRVDLAVIWLHGLGADSSDFLPVIAALKLATGVRFVFPNAPQRRITINGGMMMRAWYDITGFGPDAAADMAGIGASVTLVNSLIERELGRGIDARRIVLAGFSQGGAVVLQAGLSTALPLGGILGLSTYLPAPGLLGPGVIATQVPVWLAHGTHDPVIPLSTAERSAKFLIAQGVDVEWTTYAMGHELSSAEVNDINDWLNRIASR